MLMCQLSVYLYAEGAPVPSLLHIWREPTDTKYWSQCFWCVNCQHICQQKMHLWTVPSLLHIWTCPNAFDVSIPMFLNTGNHLGLQEDTHYCPNARCWCVNCQFICMQKVHQFPVCFIYEGSLQIQNTGPNAFDVSTVSISVSKRCTFGLFPACFIYEESMYAERHVNLSQCFWCVNCQLICQQKMHLWTVPSFIYEESMFAERHVNLSQSCCCVNCQHICKHVPRILKDHTMANHNKAFHAIPDHGKP